jgi:pimeloyl-ACP methyl ester carboxylesterase
MAARHDKESEISMSIATAVRQRAVTAVAAATGISLLAIPPGIPAAAGTPAVAARPVLDWQSCGPGSSPQSECAPLRVPMDWSDPRGPQVTIPVARHKATDQRHKIGTLLVTTGSFQSNVDMVARAAFDVFTQRAPELIARFDVIGIDPRGRPHETPIPGETLRCPSATYDPAVNPFPANPTEYQQMIASTRAIGLDCLAATGPYLWHLNPASQAQDVEAIRRAIHAPKLSWLAFTGQAQAAREYARRYPNRVRAMVLDDPLGPGSTDQLVAEGALATENAFNRFADWCRRDASCALHDGDPAQAYHDLLARAAGQPIPAAGVDHPLTTPELATLSTQYLAQARGKWDPRQPLDGWQTLAAAIAQALHGNADLFGYLYPYAYNPAYYGVRKATTCASLTPDETDYPRMRTRIELVRALAPTTGGVSELWDIHTGCIGWPPRPVPLPEPDWASGSAHVLVVAGRNDPASPFPGSVRVARSFTRAALLVNDADGHISFGTSQCVADHQQRYLVTLTTPAASTTCR